MRLTPNGRSVRVLVSAISVSSNSGPIAPQAITPNPPALEMAETRLRSEIQLIAPPMIATSQPRNSVPRCISSLRRAWPTLAWTARGSAISPSPLMPAAPPTRRPSSPKAVWSTRTASSSWSSAISALTLISLDETASRLILPLGQHLEHRRRELRIGADADADDADLGDRVVVDQLGIADLTFALLDHRHRLGEAGARDGEGQVARARVGVAAWTIMSTWIPGLGERADHLARPCPAGRARRSA